MRRIAAVAALLLTLVTMVHAAGPGSGTMSKQGVDMGACVADSVTVQWNLDSLFGEPTVNGSFKWTGNSGCELHYSTIILLEVKTNSGGKGYVKLAPVVPNVNSGYGYNTTGSPNWSATLCGYEGNVATECLDSASAKAIWQDGYVSNFYVAWDVNAYSGGSTSGAQNGVLGLEGSVSYATNPSQNTVNIKIDKINNTRYDATGTLQYKLYATDTPYSGGTITGYVLAESDYLDPLQFNQYYYDIDHTLSYIAPPDGNYYVTLVLLMYENDAFVIVDYLSFDGRECFGSCMAASSSSQPYYYTSSSSSSSSVSSASSSSYSSASTSVICEQLSGRSYAVSGYFAKYGPAAYDWVYTSPGGMAAKLEGMNAKGELEWHLVNSGSVKLVESASMSDQNRVMSFGAITQAGKGSFAEMLEQNSFSVNGAFVHYGSGAYDWIYITPSLSLIAKLTGLDTQTQSLTWQILKSDSGNCFDGSTYLDLANGYVGFGGLK